MKLTRIYSVLSVLGLCAATLQAFAGTSSSIEAVTSSDSTSGATSTSSSSTTVTAPSITTQPSSLLVNVGGTATFTVAATGTATLRYAWLKDGRRVDGATSATLTLSNVTAANAGLYSVVVSNDGGRVVSNGAALDVNVVAGTLGTTLANQNARAGANVTFNPAATGSGLTYQWSFNGRTLSGQTSASLALTNVGVLSAGAYSVTVSNASGTAAVATATLTVTTDARLTNISTRGHVGSADDQLLVGFVIRGQGSKQILMRAVGPTLKTAFNVTDALMTPQLTLMGFSHGKYITDTNTAWGGGTTLSQVFSQVGAFPLPATSADSALLESLDTGVFTSVISGVGGASGIALAEVYDADTGAPSAEIINISSRARVGAEAANTLIAGFAISGTTSDTVLIRGVGPSLGTLFGMRQALGASQVTLYDAKGNPIAVNSGWGASASGDEDEDKEAEVDEVNDRVGAFHLARGSHDSAIIATLPPGVYSAHVTGVNQSTGIALVEIYEVR